VKAATQLISKNDFERHLQEDEKQFGEIKQEIAGLRKERKEDVGLLHKRLNTVSETNAAQTAKQELTNQTMVYLHGKVDRILERFGIERPPPPVPPHS